MCEEEMGKTDVAPTSQTVKSWLVLIDRQHRLLTDISTVRGEQMSIPVCLTPAGLTAPKTDRRGKGEAGVKVSVLVLTPLPPGTLLHLQLDLVDLLWAISGVWPVTNTISIPWEILRNAHFPRSISDLL